MFCRDCGETTKKHSKRYDVCQDCFEKRGQTLKLVVEKN